MPHINPPSYEEFCASIDGIEQTTKHDNKTRQMISIAVKAQFDNGRPANITFLGKKHSEESLEKMRSKRAGKTPSKGKTWKRTPESIARAMETQRLNRLKKLKIDI
jgi:hypothetical protein